MFENIKSKAVKFATNPKCVKAVNKLYNAASAGAVAVGTMAATGITASAEDGAAAGVGFGEIITATAAVNQITTNASPFLEPAIIIMCSVGGLKLGMRFLRGAAH